MENLDSVCYINKINKIAPIDGADKIELCTVNGWTSVTQKGIHKEGDLVLCITTDAVIPESLAINWGCINYLRNKSRVRTVKLKGVYSECILIPLTDLNYIDLQEGVDMMHILKIFKYEPSIREVVVSVPGLGKSMDVGVDTNNLYPYHLDEIMDIMNKIPINIIDHHNQNTN